MPRARLLTSLVLLSACGDAGGASTDTGGHATDPPAATSTGPHAPTGTTTAASTADTTEPASTDFITEPTGTTDEPPATTADTTTDAAPTTSDDDTTGAPTLPVPLRALFINVGNASPQFGCFEYKLCRPQDVASVRAYIDAWQPDVIALSEVLRADQLTGEAAGGPILPPGYAGRCGESRDRATDQPAAWDADDASHEHECVAWRTARAAEVRGAAASVYGADGCNYDFTGFRTVVRIDGAHDVTVVAVHPDSQHADCRTAEIAAYWSELAVGPRVVIGGDWNSEKDDELQRPPGFAVAYLRGQHWDLATHDGEYSAEYAFGLDKKKFDHAFVDFGAPVTATLPFGSALGGHDDHPRADGGDGLDHRQVLIDLEFTP